MQPAERAKTAAESNKWANTQMYKQYKENIRWQMNWLYKQLNLIAKSSYFGAEKWQHLICSNHATESGWKNWRQNQQGIEEWRWGNSFNIILIYHIWPWPWDLISHISALTVCFNGYGENVTTSKPCGDKTCTINASPPGSAKHSNYICVCASLIDLNLGHNMPAVDDHGRDIWVHILRCDECGEETSTHLLTHCIVVSFTQWLVHGRGSPADNSGEHKAGLDHR